MLGDSHISCFSSRRLSSRPPILNFPPFSPSVALLHPCLSVMYVTQGPCPCPRRAWASRKLHRTVFLFDYTEKQVCCHCCYLVSVWMQTADCAYYVLLRPLPRAGKTRPLEVNLKGNWIVIRVIDSCNVRPESVATAPTTARLTLTCLPKQR